MKIVAFDFDGVIRDSREAFINTTKSFLAQKGWPPISEDEYSKFNTVSGGKWREDIFKHLGVEDDPQAEFKDIYTIEFAKQSTKTYDGIVEAIKEVENAGYKTCLITNNSTVRIKDKIVPLTLVGIEFDYIRACDWDMYKPDPKYIDRVLEYFTCEPSDIIYIGDLYEDYEFANKIGMNFIWAAYGLDNGRMADIHGIHKVNSPSEIPNAISELTKINI